MGIVEFVLDRERRLSEQRGEKKGKEAQKLAFVLKMIKSTDFDDAQIAGLADVTLDVIKKIRLEHK